MDLVKELEKQKKKIMETPEIPIAGKYVSQFGYYGKHDLIRDRATWELSCAIILKDWRRVRNAILILNGGAKHEQNEAER